MSTFDRDEDEVWKMHGEFCDFLGFIWFMYATWEYNVYYLILVDMFFD